MYFLIFETLRGEKHGSNFARLPHFIVLANIIYYITYIITFGINVSFRLGEILRTEEVRILKIIGRHTCL